MVLLTRADGPGRIESCIVAESRSWNGPLTSDEDAEALRRLSRDDWSELYYRPRARLFARPLRFAWPGWVNVKLVLEAGSSQVCLSRGYTRSR